MTSFLKEVATELVESGIQNPTVEQIGAAMLTRINRQGQIFNQIFAHSFSSTQTDRQRETRRAISDAVYHQIRSEQTNG